MTVDEPRPKTSPEEPLILSALPFAGVGLLLLLALIWRLLPGEKTMSVAEEERVRSVVERWERAQPADIEEAVDRDFTLGPDEARVTIVEYSDFECPYCKTAANDVKQVLDFYGNDVRLVFKNLPLDFACNDEIRQQLHPHACEAAELARCAGAQSPELFWKAHDALFRANGLSPDVLARIPNELGLSQDAFETCMASNEQMDSIREDVAAAYAMGVTGTPTFFIEGRKLYDYRNGAIARVVAQALAEN